MRSPSVPVAADGHKKTVSSPQRPHTVHSFIRFLRIKFALSAYFPLEIALSMPYNGFTWSCSTSCDRWKRHKAMRYGRDSRLQVPCVGAGNTAQGFSIPYYSPFSQNTQEKTHTNPPVNLPNTRYNCNFCGFKGHSTRPRQGNPRPRRWFCLCWPQIVAAVPRPRRCPLAVAAAGDPAEGHPARCRYPSAAFARSAAICSISRRVTSSHTARTRERYQYNAN